MKAAAFFKTGGPEVVEYVDLPDPIPGPEEVIIRTEAVGLNFADIYRRRGEYTTEPPAPYVMGYEGAGTIHSVGTAVKDFSIGDRVGFAHVPRANAELVKAPAWKVIPLPNEISFEIAGALLLQGMTAHYLTHDSYKVTAKDTVLIHSASGGVGLLLIQICRILGAKVIGTVSSPEKANLAKSVGASSVVIRTGDWKKEVLTLTQGKGVDIAYDAIGSTLEETLAVVKARGSLVYYGSAGGPPPRIDPNSLMEQSKVLIGGELWSHVATREDLLRRSSALFSWIKEAKLSVHISGKFPLSETVAAHRALESGKTTGKILLIRI